MRTFIITALLLITTSLASAQDVSDDERARSHFAAGTSYFDQHRYDEAAEQFLESYRLSRRAPLLLNVASAYERGGDHARAVEVLERYLAEHPEATDRATVEGRLSEARRHVAEDAAAASSSAAAPPTVAPAEEGALGMSGVAGISVAAVGVLAGVAAIITGVVALDAHASLDSRCGPSGTDCPPGFEADADLGSSMAVANTVLIPVSLVALAAGTTLLILDLTDGSSSESPSAALLPGPGDVGLSVRLSF